MMLDHLQVKPNSYYYERRAIQRPDKYADLRERIKEISASSGQTYGSPRIWLALRREGVVVSEKVVRRIMKEEGVVVHYAMRRRKYSSYIGEITPAVENRVMGSFRAEAPNKLWLTDITEFSAGTAKVYLSPMIDCFDGKVVAWASSRRPDMGLVSSMLGDALGVVDVEGACADGGLMIHTDRGGITGEAPG